jgi:hypothetical protein
VHCSQATQRTHSPLYCPWRTQLVRDGFVIPKPSHCVGLQFRVIKKKISINLRNHRRQPGFATCARSHILILRCGKILCCSGIQYTCTTIFKCCLLCPKTSLERVT